MFSYLRKRTLVAGVAAEIKAQCKSQELVRSVCFTPIGQHMILELGEERFRDRGRLRYFMISTFLLAETMRTCEIPLDIKTACLELLHDRRVKITNHMAKGYGRVTLKQEDIDDLDEIMDIGIQLFHTERREAMAKHIEEESGIDLSWMKDQRS